MYLVCGATGNTGSIVADELLKASKKVRVIGRDESKLKPFTDKGAEAMTGDMADGSFLEAAFKGVDAAYVMIPVHFGVDDYRAYQTEIGKHIANAVKKNGIKHVVTLSSVGADQPDGTGPIVGLHRLEEELGRIDGLHALHLRPTFFMENLFTNIPLIKGQGIFGMPAPADVPLAMIATKDIGHYAARRLLALDFSGRDFQDLLGQKDVTLNEVATALGNAIDKADLKFVQTTYDQEREGMLAFGLKEDIVNLYIEMYEGMATGKVRPSHPRNDESTTPTSIAEFAKTFAHVYKSS